MAGTQAAVRDGDTTAPPMSPRHRLTSVNHDKSIPFIIGVAGGTGSGKTTVCRELESRSNSGSKGCRVIILSQDQFYKEVPSESDTASYNFDHPSAFDEDLLVDALEKLKGRESVVLKRYNMGTYTRSKETITVSAADVVILEGILVLYSARVRALLDMTLFVDLDSDTRLSRRVVRDVALGRDLDAILHVYTTMVKPAFEEFAEPTKKYADLIIPRGSENTVAIELVVQHIRQILGTADGDEAPYPHTSSPTARRDGAAGNAEGHLGTSKTHH